MSENRIAQYFNLIDSVLECPENEAMELLEANPELLDKDLIKVMMATALNLIGEEDEEKVQWLMDLATTLTEKLGIEMGEGEETTNQYSLVGDLLKVAADGNAEVMYGFLADNLDKLDENFRSVLVKSVTDYITIKPDFTMVVLALLENLCVDFQNFPLGDVANNMEIAIAGHQFVLDRREKNTEAWARSQNNLAIAYEERVKGKKADNMEKAIACYEAALRGYTKMAFPESWGMTQYNLGMAYTERTKGKKRDNLEKAIACYNAVVTVYTKSAFPQEWADTQYSLGVACGERLKGKKADNLELAIAAFNAALTVYKKGTADWARTQNGLGNAYRDRIKGKKVDNREMAIASYEAALKFYNSNMLFSEEWKMVQRNLGILFQGETE